MPTSLSFPDGGGSIQLCRSAPVSWHLPGHPGILTLRDQPVADEQKHCRPGQQARPALCPEGSAADVVRRAGILRQDLATGPALAVLGCVPVGILLAALGSASSAVKWGLLGPPVKARGEDTQGASRRGSGGRIMAALFSLV